MKRTVAFLLVFLLFYGVSHSRDAMLFLKKFDDTNVAGKLVEIGKDNLVLLTVNNTRETVQVRDIESLTYHINKGKPWGTVMAGVALGASLGVLIKREGYYDSPKKRGQFVIGWSVLGAGLGALVALASPSSKKMGKITMLGKSHNQKMAELKKFEKYALFRKRNTYYRGRRR